MDYLNFPSVLQYGDNIEITGKVGPTKLCVDLLSDYLAFDPVQSDRMTEADDDLPVTKPEPLQIIFDVTTGWDVNANSPETSSCSHGSSVKRYGFCTGQAFTCTIAIRRELFEVYLNGTKIATSEHLIPVGSIHGIQIGGDSMIENIRYGHPAAIERHARSHSSTNGFPVECRLTSDTDEEFDYTSDQESPMKQSKLLSKSASDLRLPKVRKNAVSGFKSLNQLTRTESYQLVFDSDESDVEQRRVPSKISQVQLPKVPSTNDMLLLDDPAFVIDEPLPANSNRRNSELKKNHPTEHMKKQMSSVARKAEARKQKLKMEAIHRFNPTAPMNQIKSASYNDLIAPEGLTTRQFEQKTIAFHDVQATQDDSSEDLTETESDESLSDLDGALSSDLSPPSISSLKRQKTQTFPPKPEAPNGEPHKTQTLDSNKPKMVVRKPLSSLDRLWDSILPNPMAKRDQVQPILTTTHENDKSSEKLSEHTSETDYEQDWREEIVYRHMSDADNSELIVNKQTDWNSHAFREHTSSDYISEPQSSRDSTATFDSNYSEVLLTCESESSARLIEECHEYRATVAPQTCPKMFEPFKQLNQPTVNEPLLLIDQRPLQNGKFLTEFEAEVFNIHTNPNVRTSLWSNQQNNLKVNQSADSHVQCNAKIPDEAKPGKIEIIREKPKCGKSYTRSTISSQYKKLLTSENNMRNSPKDTKPKIFRSRLGPRKVITADKPQTANGNSHITQQPEENDSRGQSVPLEQNEPQNSPVINMAESIHVCQEFIELPAPKQNGNTEKSMPRSQPTANGTKNTKDSEIIPDIPKQNGMLNFAHSPRNWFTRKFSSYRKQNQLIQRSPTALVVSANNNLS